MKKFYFDGKQNVLFINTNLIMYGNTVKQKLEYMKKTYSERINNSQYKEQINNELKKHPGCLISEFMDV